MPSGTFHSPEAVPAPVPLLKATKTFDPILPQRATVGSGADVNPGRNFLSAGTATTEMHG